MGGAARVMAEYQDLDYHISTVSVKEYLEVIGGARVRGGRMEQGIWRMEIRRQGEWGPGKAHNRTLGNHIGMRHPVEVIEQSNLGLARVRKVVLSESGKTCS
jgi:hypothetical protein